MTAAPAAPRSSRFGNKSKNGKHRIQKTTKCKSCPHLPDEDDRDTAAPLAMSLAEEPADAAAAGHRPPKRVRRSQTVSAQDKLDTYTELYRRILVAPNSEVQPNSEVHATSFGATRPPRELRRLPPCRPLYMKDLTDKELRVLMREKEVRKTPSCQVGPEVGPTSAFYSRTCIPTGMHGPTCVVLDQPDTFLA